jgi:hypothetical protein
MNPSTLPRSVYAKPPKNPETQKRPTEKIIKKIQRSWQKSIQQAEDIRRGDYPRPTWMKKIIGGAFWVCFSSNSARFWLESCLTNQLKFVIALLTCQSTQILCVPVYGGLFEVHHHQRCTNVSSIATGKKNRSS